MDFFNLCVKFRGLAEFVQIRSPAVQLRKNYTTFGTLTEFRMRVCAKRDKLSTATLIVNDPNPADEHKLGNIMEDDLPATSGTYVLHFEISRRQSISVGRLGRRILVAGDYFYVGSACGAGGLRARVGRHLRGDGKPHWHIDYVRASTPVTSVFYAAAPHPIECRWSQALAQLPTAFIPVPQFGSSDCRAGCAAHLVAFPRPLLHASLKEVLSAASPWPVVQLHYG